MSIDSDVLGLTEYRSYIAELLRDGISGEVSVMDGIPDSVAPPTIYVAWANPWLVSTTWCEYTMLLQLIVVAQRIEPGGQYGIIESLIGEVLRILKTNRIALRDVSSPFPINLGGADYLASAINLVTELGD